MKQLVILCHPSGDDFNQLIWNELELTYEKYKLDFEVRDLYKIGFNPIVSVEDIAAAKNGTALKDVQIEQEHISESDFLTFVYPIWWTGMPAMLKGYIDRVLSEGFAYSISDAGKVNKLLHGKKVVIVNTFGQTSNLYKMGFYDHAMTYEKQIFESCGMEVILHYYLENVDVEADTNALKVKLNDLKIEIKKTMALSRNSQLSIPTTFF